MEKFKKLNIPDYILKVIEQDKFEEPSEVQEKAIPPVLAGKDVIAESATGSGKTLAFGAGIIQNCEKLGSIQSLILVPTRELAEQVSKSLKHFSMYKNLEITEVYGGVSISPQISKLRRADVVVGTPGRILDHMQRQTIDLSGVTILVLDEADRMLDMGFIQDVEKIISQCPIKRQTLLFSATISREISELSQRFMQNPVKVSAEPQVDPSKLKQYYYDVDDAMKFSLLVHLLKHEHPGLVMVFCNTQRNTDFVSKNLESQGIEAVGIHGGLSQDKRNRVMSLFHANKVYVLVCTDVAARGLDIKGVSHVYNYDIPNEANQYVHRIGRTARAGKEGVAVNIVASRDYDNFAGVKKLNYDMTIEKKEIPEIERVFVKFKGDSRFGGGGRRFGGGGGYGRGSRYGGGSRGFSSGGSGGRSSSFEATPGFYAGRSSNNPRRAHNLHRKRGQRGLRRSGYFNR
jgi:ATP-dependent RNA helicase DeaD